jgi:hypothetical protein
MLVENGAKLTAAGNGSLFRTAKGIEAVCYDGGGMEGESKWRNFTPTTRKTDEHERNMALKTDQPGLNPEVSSERRAAVQASL